MGLGGVIFRDNVRVAFKVIFGLGLELWLR